MKRFVLGLMALVSANCYAENAEPDTTKVEQLQETVLGLAYILLEYKASIWMWAVGFAMQALGWRSSLPFGGLSIGCLSRSLTAMCR